MATVSLSSPPSAGGSGPRGPTYQVTTRELSADFSNVGADEETRELGLVDAARFRTLLDQLVAIDSIKLVDADPQLLVTVKSGRFLIQPQGGKLLVRPANALDQMFFKLSPAEIPSFLDNTAPPPPPPPPATPLIGTASARAEAAPIAPPAISPPERSRLGLYAGFGVVVFVLAGGAWFFFAATPAPTVPKPNATRQPPAEFELAPATELARLQKQFSGTFATSGDSGERLLELRADSTFHYREFGSSLAVTSRVDGSYSFALRHSTKKPVLRAGRLGVIELRDENSVVIRDVVFTRLPAPAK